MYKKRVKRALRKRYKLQKCNNSNLLRLSVFRSINNIYVQIIDDSKRTTLVSASSIEKDLLDKVKDMKKVSVANEVGKLIAQRALSSGIRKVVFDCGSYKYHGRVAAVANSARECGLVI